MRNLRSTPPTPPSVPHSPPGWRARPRPLCESRAITAAPCACAPSKRGFPPFRPGHSSSCPCGSSHSGDGCLTPEELTHIRGRLTRGAALFVLYIVIATPGIQDVVRDYELNDWETTEGTVITIPGIQDWYLYSVDDGEYTGSKEAFRWDQTWSDNGPSLTTTLCVRVNGFWSTICTVTLPAGETLDLVFGDSTSWTSEFSMTVLTPGAPPPRRHHRHLRLQRCPGLLHHGWGLHYPTV